MGRVREPLEHLGTQENHALRQAEQELEIQNLGHRVTSMQSTLVAWPEEMVAHLTAAGPCVEIIASLDKHERSLEETKQQLQDSRLQQSLQERSLQDVQQLVKDLAVQMHSQPLELLEQLRETFASQDALQTIPEGDVACSGSPQLDESVLARLEERDIALRELTLLVHELANQGPAGNSDTSLFVRQEQLLEAIREVKMQVQDWCQQGARRELLEGLLSRVDDQEQCLIEVRAQLLELRRQFAKIRCAARLAESQEQPLLYSEQLRPGDESLDEVGAASQLRAPLRRIDNG